MEFAEYVARQRPALLRFATVLTCRTWLAEDLVSDVLGRAFERWERISGMAEPNAYVRRMVVRLVPVAATVVAVAGLVAGVVWLVPGDSGTHVAGPPTTSSTTARGQVPTSPDDLIARFRVVLGTAQPAPGAVSYLACLKRPDGTMVLMRLSNQEDPWGAEINSLGGEVYSPQPPLTLAQLKAIVTSDKW